MLWKKSGERAHGTLTENMDLRFKGAANVSGVLTWKLLLVVSLLCACEPPSEQRNDQRAASDRRVRYTDGSPTIAQLGDIKVSQATVERRLAEMSPITRARYQDPERRREFLDSLIRFELLADEAKRRGHAEHPEVQLAYKQAMVRELLRNEIRELVKIGDITDQEIESYYQENLKSYQRPHLIRASHILFKTEAEAIATLKLIQLKITADPKQKRVIFGELAAEKSLDHESRARRGDLQYFTRQGELIGERLFPQSPVLPEVVESAFKLSAVGELTEVPVKSSAGWHIIQRTGGKRAVKRELSQVKTEIRNTLFRTRKAKALEDYVQALKQRVKININQEALERIKLKSDARSREPKLTLPSPLIPQRP